MTITLSFKNKLDRYNRDTIRFYVVHLNQRKWINTGIKIEPKYMDKRTWRVKVSSKNQEEYNIALSNAKEKINKALTKFETNQFTYNQVVAYLKGEIDYGTVDKYIETVIKNSRSEYTYTDYKNTLSAFKKHLGISKETEVTFTEFSSFETLDRFKRQALKTIAPTSLNSYWNKIRAILNDAYDKGYIFEKFTLKKSLRVQGRPSKSIQTITPEEFRKAIEKCNSIFDAQALALYLLMFGLRGMYPSDITALKDAEYKCNDFNTKDPYLNIFNDGKEYLVHRRVKTKNSSNDDLIIRIDRNIPFLLNNLKKLFKVTHIDRGVLSKNELALFDYNLQDASFHKNLWDVYQKRIKITLGFSFQTARKTYNTYATELEVSNTVRDILLGHAPKSINEKHYVNRNTIKLSKKVQDAHTEILEDFEFEALSQKLYVKMINYWSKHDKQKTKDLLLNDIEEKIKKVFL